MGLKSNDFLEESLINLDAWTAIHTMRKQRPHILKLILPTEIYQTYENEQELIKSYVFGQLSNRVNDIIQDNFFFLVENNMGNLTVVEDLFDQVATYLTKHQLLDKIDSLTVEKIH